MKRGWSCLLAAALLMPLLAGCRSRTVADPALADRIEWVEHVVYEEQPPPPPEEPEKPPEKPEEPPEEPEEPEEPEPQEESEAPSAESQESALPQEEPVARKEFLSEEAEEARPEEISAPGEVGNPEYREEPALGIEVIYDPNGGNSEPVRTVVSSGGTYGPQPEVSRRAHAFAGWWTMASGGVQVFPDTPVTRESAHILYAHWEERETRTVTFDGNGGRVKSRDTERALGEGDTFGALPNALREGYSLTGWFTAPEGGEQIGEEDIFPGTEDLILYAQWSYDPLSFWSFALQNGFQQVYLCQRDPLYLETQSGTTVIYKVLLTADGVLQYLKDKSDQWIRDQKPAIAVKVIDSLSESESARREMAARFPEQEIVLLLGTALWDQGEGLYAELAVAKHLYGDWFTDVDLTVVAQELGVSEIPIMFEGGNP